MKPAAGKNFSATQLFKYVAALKVTNTEHWKGARKFPDLQHFLS